MKKKQAIISVYDKTGLAEFARGLAALGVEILSTGGTAKFLSEQGIEQRSISEYTGSPEILDGRVKSLHPKIHGGILARRDNERDMLQLEQQQIAAVDFVVVNLYPFIQQTRKVEASANPEHESLVEYIDIGGPTMIRAAAKNCRYVLPICDPLDYKMVLEQLAAQGEIPITTRQRLAAKVFAMMAAYDGAIARYYSLNEKILLPSGEPVQLAPVETLVIERQLDLRYGENPHQHAALYRRIVEGANALPSWWQQIQGKELSYNNLLDMQATIDLFLELTEGEQCAKSELSAAVIIKHSNPCGSAYAKTPLQAFRRAWECDPLSAFGGIVAVSGQVDQELAQAITEGFIEVLLAEEFSTGAQEVLRQKKNMRVISCDFAAYRAARSKGDITLRNSYGDFLLQSADLQTTIAEPADSAVAGQLPNGEAAEGIRADLSFAWKVCKHVKSNAIVIVKNGRAVGVGAGQMSRVDAARLAVQRAVFHGHDISGAVAASDAFLPFPDTLEILNDAGITALVQPGGSLKDKDVIAEANRRKMLMVFTGERHFRH